MAYNKRNNRFSGSALAV